MPPQNEGSKTAVKYGHQKTDASILSVQTRVFYMYEFSLCKMTSCAVVYVFIRFLFVIKTVIAGYIFLIFSKKNH